MPDVMDPPQQSTPTESSAGHGRAIDRAATSVREVDNGLRESLGARGGAISTGLAGAGVGLAVGEIGGAVIGALIGAIVGAIGLKRPTH